MAAAASTLRKKAAILLNLGTPDSPSVPDVRKYLREFLMDPYVVDIAAPLRLLLVHGIILPRRPEVSAEAYKKIWDSRGSPLRYYLDDLVALTRKELGSDWTIVPAMRYGSPSVQSAFDALKSEAPDEIVVFSLYPQYSLSATESSIQAVRAIAGKSLPKAKLQFIEPFHHREEFLAPFARVIAESIGGPRPFDHVLFSFHGLPERQVRKTDRSPRQNHCFESSGCCDTLGKANRDCYRAQCYATARALAGRLKLEAPRWSVSFQSRLGRTPWIKPYTDHVIDELAAKGVKRLAVTCPAFVADCLETLEEIQLRARDQFRRAGGEELVLIPSLNASPDWARGVAALIREKGARA